MFAACNIREKAADAATKGVEQLIESMRKLAKTLGRTVVAVRARLTKIRKEEKEKR